MKKILFLLLLSVAMYGQVPADATPLENIQITNNQTSTTATKVNVQENDGTINTKPLSELANYLEFASAVNLPVTGEQGKLYLTKDNNRLYRFNGTIYQEISAYETTATIQAKRPLKTIENQSLEGSGNIDLSKSDVGLGNVDNTSDANKPISTATQTALNGKENSFTKNTAFNKNFGTTAGTVVEGGTLGSNAYSSTAFLPISSNNTGTLGAINVYGTGVNTYLGVINLKNGMGAKEWRLSTGIEVNTQEGFGIKNVTDNNHPIWILNSGNVGIGTTTPTAKLDVNGTFNATGAATFSSTVTASGGFFNSDRRLKNIFKRDGDVAYYTWKDGRDTKEHIGYVAQEVQEKHPNQVQADEKGMLSVNYVEILVEKIRILEKRIEQLEKSK